VSPHWPGRSADLSREGGDAFSYPGLFEDRYGPGSLKRLLELLGQPCATFAHIAGEFGVTRECVRQWHQRLLPDAPAGHERQRLCRELQHKRRLLQDALFLGFYRRVRAQVPSQRVTLIPSREGFRRRTVRIGGRTVVLRRARRSGLSPRWGGGVEYALLAGNTEADFIYYELSTAEYLFVPRKLLPAHRTLFLDTDGSAFHRFKNTMAALSEGRQAERRADGGRGEDAWRIRT
jgi:transposase-like protein